MGKEEEYPLPAPAVEDFNRAVESMEMGEDQETPRKVFERLLKSEPDHPRLLLALGLTYFHEKNFGEAERIFLKAFELYPNFSLVYSHLSIVYSWTARCNEAAEYAEKAIKLNPESPMNWNAMGLRYGHDGNYEMALGHFLAAYALDPSYHLSAFNAACTYAVLGETGKALEFLKTAFSSRRFVCFAETDPDLASVRVMREFKALLSEAWKRLGVN